MSVIIDRDDIYTDNKNSGNSVGSGENPHVTEGAELCSDDPPHTTARLL